MSAAVIKVIEEGYKPFSLSDLRDATGLNESDLITTLEQLEESKQLVKYTIEDHNISLYYSSAFASDHFGQQSNPPAENSVSEGSTIGDREEEPPSKPAVPTVQPTSKLRVGLKRRSGNFSVS
jgi:hypothetical protein